MIINYESLELLNFPSHIIALIKACMASVSPSRGLHQGDPMSPLLFVIALKHLSHMILDASQIWHGGIAISHLMFVDDIILVAEEFPHRLCSKFWRFLSCLA